MTIVISDKTSLHSKLVRRDREEQFTFIKGNTSKYYNSKHVCIKYRYNKFHTRNISRPKTTKKTHNAVLLGRGFTHHSHPQ